MDFKGCPQCGVRGTVLGAIVAKETSSSAFTGTATATGIGIGSGGVGVGVGSVSGSSTHTSHLAAQLSAPEPQARDPTCKAFLYGIAMLFLAAMTYRGLPAVLSMLGEGNEGSQEISQGFMDVAAIGISATMVIMALFMFYSALTMDNESEDIKIFNRDLAQDRARLAVHERLRYCESDHQVFDPVTGKGCVAEEHYIHHMVSSIASAEMSSPSA